MAYIQFASLSAIQAAAQAIGATPAFDDGTPACAVWFGFDVPSAQNVVTPTQGADGTYLFSTYHWSQLTLDWIASQAFAGYLGSGLGDAPPGWTPAVPPTP